MCICIEQAIFLTGQASMPITETQRQLMDQLEWFHALDLGEVQTCGRFRPDTPQNQTLFSVLDLLEHIDVRGFSCLDIGATDGLVSFGLEKLGAAEVVATDRVVGRGFALVHEILESHVHFLAPVEISTLYEAVGERRFDLIICAGVIYHMFNPQDAFLVCRSLLKPNGLLIVESAITQTPDPVLVLNSETGELAETSSYWLPSLTAMAGMMRLAWCDVLASREVEGLNRAAVLGRAVSDAGLIGERSPLLERMQHMAPLDYTFSSRLEKARELEPSAIRYEGRTGPAKVSPQSYIPRFPLHAHRPVDALGKRAWRTVDLAPAKPASPAS